MPFIKISTIDVCAQSTALDEDDANDYLVEKVHIGKFEEGLFISIYDRAGTRSKLQAQSARLMRELQTFASESKTEFHIDHKTSQAKNWHEDPPGQFENHFHIHIENDAINVLEALINLLCKRHFIPEEMGNIIICEINRAPATPLITLQEGKEAVADSGSKPIVGEDPDGEQRKKPWKPFG